MISSRKRQHRRCESEIIKLLREKASKGQHAFAFCQQHAISKQTLYNWQKKFGSMSRLNHDFIPVTLERSVHADPVPFCELTISDKTSIRIFQPVDAKFISKLIAR